MLPRRPANQAMRDEPVPSLSHSPDEGRVVRFADRPETTEGDQIAINIMRLGLVLGRGEIGKQPPRQDIERELNNLCERRQKSSGLATMATLIVRLSQMRAPRRTPYAPISSRDKRLD